jgi:hypothetical protein
MGITVSPASSSGGGGGGSSGTLPVIPGTAVTREIYTDTGFTTGDYVYRYGNGSVGNIFPLSFTSFSVSPLINGTIPTYGIGTSTIAKSEITVPQRIPSTVSYTGATKTYATNVQAATTLQATSNPAQVETALLSNGNIVTVFNTTAATTTLLFQISTSAGAAVSNGTVTTAMRNTTSFSNAWSVCALNGGGFIVAFESSTGIRTTVYSNSGSVTRAETLSTAEAGRYYPCVAVSSSDVVYISYCMGANNDSTGRIMSINSAGTQSAVISSMAGNQYYPSGKISISVNTDGVIGWCFSDVSAISGYQTFIYGWVNGATLSSSAGNYTSDGSAYYCYNPCTVAIPGGHFVYFTINSSNFLYTTAWRQVSPSTYNNSSQASTIALTANNVTIKAIQYTGTTSGVYSATSQTNALAVVNNGGNLSSVIVSFNGSTGSIAYSTATSLSTAINGSYNYSVCYLNNSDFAVVYRSATPNPTLKTFIGYTLTNGTTTPTPATAAAIPANGYYLLGVATTTASAGTTGTIAINGKVNLSASYATSATPIGFDYNPLNRSGFPNGNKGYVVNRVVTLTGLE